MPTYRIYFLDQGAHISQPPKVIECDNDSEAIQKARQFIDGKDLEVWGEFNLIAKFPHT